MVSSMDVFIPSKLNKTLALISDIHYAKNYPMKRLQSIYEDLKYHEPNYICMVGDLLDQGNALENIEDKKIFLDWLKMVAQIAPVIIVFGNHDIGVRGNGWIHYDVKENIKELSLISNVYVLDNKAITMNHICFLGYHLPFDYYDKKRGEQVELYQADIDQKLRLHLKKDCYPILLCHSPIYVTHPKVRETEVLKSVQLVLSGHMHRGIIPLHIKGNYGLISPSKKWFPKYAWGNFSIGETQYVVSGGILTFSNVSPSIFHPFNWIYPPCVEYIHLEQKNLVKKSDWICVND